MHAPRTLSEAEKDTFNSLLERYNRIFGDLQAYTRRLKELRKKYKDQHEGASPELKKKCQEAISQGKELQEELLNQATEYHLASIGGPTNLQEDEEVDVEEYCEGMRSLEESVHTMVQSIQDAINRLNIELAQ